MRIRWLRVSRIAAAALAIWGAGLFAGWKLGSREGQPDPRQEVKADVDRAAAISSCLQVDLCGESARLGEAGFNSSRTAAHERMNVALRTAAEAARSDNALLDTLKAELRTHSSLVETANVETAGIVADVMLSGEVTAADASFLADTAMASGASEVLVRMANMPATAPKNEAVQRAIRMLGDNNPLLEETLASIRGGSLRQEHVMRLVAAGCAYKQKDTWVDNWPWVLHHLQRIASEKGVKEMVEQMCAPAPRS